MLMRFQLRLHIITMAATPTSQETNLLVNSEPTQNLARVGESYPKT